MNFLFGAEVGCAMRGGGGITSSIGRDKVHQESPVVLAGASVEEFSFEKGYKWSINLTCREE